jgi:alanine racemase
MASAPDSPLKTTVTSLRDVLPGTPISYSRTFTASSPMKIATLSIGYAVGYPRGLSNKGRVIIRGCGLRRSATYAWTR